MNRLSLREFRPTVFFLLRFIGIYIIGNLLYGWFITSYETAPDPVTQFVSRNCSTILNGFGLDVAAKNNIIRPTTDLIFDGKAVLAIYEGCNGINTMIIFVAFVIAIGPRGRTMLWFIPVGLFVIHFFNLTRILLLFYVARFIPQYLYFTHKYLFTAILYAVIFILWVIWIRFFSLKRVNPTRQSQ